MHSACTALVVALIIELLGPLHALANSNQMRAPHTASARRVPLGTSITPDHLTIIRHPAEAAAAGPFTVALNFYRTVISPVDGDRCEMSPTCSLYSQQAFKEHGVVMGFLLTADRLLHEADEKPYVRTYTLAGVKYYVDPMAGNTYWLPRWLR